MTHTSPTYPVASDVLRRADELQPGDVARIGLDWVAVRVAERLPGAARDGSDLFRVEPRAGVVPAACLFYVRPPVES